MARSKTEGWSAAVLFRKQRPSRATELHFPSLGSSFFFRFGICYLPKWVVWAQCKQSWSWDRFFLGSSQLPAQRCRHAWPAFLWNIITYHWIKNWNPFFERTCASNQVIHNPRLFLLCANLDILNVHIYTSRIATWIGTCLKNQDLMHGWSSIQVLALSAFSLDCSNLAFRGTGAICNPVTRRVP